MIAEILKTGRVEKDRDCWIPTQVPDIRTFQDTLRANAGDSKLVTFYKHWPFWPINHELPKLAVPEVLSDWQDREFNPGLPTESNVDSLIYGPSNVRVNGESFAANCRHHVTSWDEHP